MNAPARSILLVAQLLLAACNEEDPKIVTNAMPLEVSAFQTSATPNLLFYNPDNLRPDVLELPDHRPYPG